MGNCPLSKIQYKGCCPVTTCFANDTRLEHGCLKQLANKNDLLKYFKASNLRFRRTASEQVVEMLALLNILDIVNQIPPYTTCRCGQKICETVNCDAKQQFLNKVKEYYAGFSLLLDNKQAVYLLELSSKKKIEPVFKPEWSEKWKTLTKAAN